MEYEERKGGGLYTSTWVGIVRTYEPDFDLLCLGDGRSIWFRHFVNKPTIGQLRSPSPISIPLRLLKLCPVSFCSKLTHLLASKSFLFAPTRKTHLSRLLHPSTSVGVE